MRVRLAALLLLLAGSSQFACVGLPWPGEKRTASQLSCGMSTAQVASIADKAGARFTHEGPCAYGAIVRNSGSIVVAFDGGQKLVYAFRANRQFGVGSREWEVVVNCNDQIQGCLPFSVEGAPSL